MKKIFIAITATTLAFVLAGCGAESATITDLSNQLDKTSHTISSFETTNPATITLQNASQHTASLSNHTRQALIDEEYYKTDILDKTSQIKQSLSQNQTLSKAQSSALGDYISNLQSYTNSAKQLHDKVAETTKSISSLKKDSTKNKNRIEAKLTTLANNSNARASYYENILHTLDEIDACINADSFDTKTTQPENTQNDTTKPSASENSDKSTDNDCKDCDSTPTDTTEEYQSRYDKFAQKRNIDTYGPTRRNIDTYGYYNRYFPYNQNGYMPYNNQMAPNNPYGYGWSNPYFNSNNFNRHLNPATAYMPASTQTEKPRLETYQQTDNENQTSTNNCNHENCDSTSQECPNCQNKQNNIQSATVQASATPIKAKLRQNIQKYSPKTGNADPNDQIIVAHNNA